MSLYWLQILNYNLRNKFIKINNNQFSFLVEFYITSSNYKLIAQLDFLNQFKTFHKNTSSIPNTLYNIINFIF